MSEEKRKDAETPVRHGANEKRLASSRPGVLAFSESSVEEAALAWLEAIGRRRSL